MNGINAPIKDTLGSSIAPSAIEDTATRWLPMDQEVGPYQILDLLTP